MDRDRWTGTDGQKEREREKSIEGKGEMERDRWTGTDGQKERDRRKGKERKV